MALLIDADVAKLVDALDLGSSAARRESSSLFPRTKVLSQAQRERAAGRRVQGGR